jgi:branched-chain amino acid transport system ATP-binding protein
MSVLELSRVVVQFGGLRALDNFDIAIARGEIHGLIGPNGAGKTTAMNVACGLIAPTGGDVRIAGEHMPRRKSELAKRGLARTFQTPAIFLDLDPVQNVMTGRQFAGRAGVLSTMLGFAAARLEDEKLRDDAVKALHRVGYDGPWRVRTSTLSYGAHRKIEVAKALLAEPKLLLLDEPTAGLSQAETDEFALMLRALKADDPELAIVLVEHNVPFVFGLCDRVTAMAQGRNIGCGSPEEVRNMSAVQESYLGSAKGLNSPVADRPKAVKLVQALEGKTVEAVLEVSSLAAGYGSVSVLRDVSLSIHKGELVALIGRNGAGKSTLLGAIAGAPKSTAGSILLGGKAIQGLATEQRVRLGLGLVPQNGGVLAAQSVAENLDLAGFAIGARRQALGAFREEIYQRFKILAERRKQLAGTLSGGQRQMLAIAMVLMRRPQVLMLDEPSIGLAPAIVDDMAEIVHGLQMEGMTILIAEQNMEWVAPLAHRAYLLDTGRIVCQLNSEQLADEAMLASAYLGDPLEAAALLGNRRDAVAVSQERLLC